MRRKATQRGCESRPGNLSAIYQLLRHNVRFYGDLVIHHVVRAFSNAVVDVLIVSSTARFSKISSSTYPRRLSRAYTNLYERYLNLSSQCALRIRPGSCDGSTTTAAYFSSSTKARAITSIHFNLEKFVAFVNFSFHLCPTFALLSNCLCSC